MDKEAVFAATLKRFLDPVQLYIEDGTVSEIMINGPQEIYIERGGKIEKTDQKFADEDALLSAARNIAQYTDKRITPQTARFDSRLPDGSRVHVVMPRCSRKGICIAIRKFSRALFTLERLRDQGSISSEAKEYLEIVVHLEKNLIVSGGTGSGKTSLLNAISGNIPDTERIIVIEDSSELQLQQEHVLSFETTGADRHGHGAVSIRDLFHSALRMRPDRIVIGECRGGEALDLVQAMTSGHGGSMSTLHANTAADALNRLETMVLMSGVEMPLAAVRAQIASAIDVVAQLNRLSDGRRVLTEICEVLPLSSDGTYRTIRVFEPAYERKASSTSPRFELKWTGNKSAYSSEINMKGLKDEVKLTKDIFGE